MNLQDPGYQEALEYYEQLIPYFNENSNGIAADMGRTNFCMGNGAMYYAEVIEIPYINNPDTGINPDLNFGMFKFPEIKGAGNPNILTGVPEGFVVSSKTKYPDECVEFLKWFLGKDVGTEQAQTIGWFNASRKVQELRELKISLSLNAYDVITSAEKMGPWFETTLCIPHYVMSI